MKRLDTTLLAELSSRKQLLFGLLLVERILHLYDRFDDAWGSDGLRSLQTCMEALYRVCRDTNAMADAHIHSLAVKAAIPDTNEYGGFEASLGQAIAIALNYCLHFATGGQDVMNIEYCSRKLVEVVDIINCEQGNEACQEQYVKSELDVQSQLLSQVEQSSEPPTQNDVDTARKLTRQFHVNMR